MRKIPWILFLLLTGCSAGHKPQNIEVVEIRTIAKEVQIPKSLMSELVKEIVNDSKAFTPVYLFMPLQVRFTEFNEGVLRKPIMQYNFPKGGGRIDLQDIVSGTGSFYLSFPAEQFDENYEFLHLYYISNSPVKNISNENFGLGCGKMIDLQKSFSKLQKPDFLKLNTSDQRYLFVTAGLYVFVFKKSSQIFMAQLSVSDSRYSKELCLEAKL